MFEVAKDAGTMYGNPAEQLKRVPVRVKQPAPGNNWFNLSMR